MSGEFRWSPSTQAPFFSIGSIDWLCQRIARHTLQIVFSDHQTFFSNKCSFEITVTKLVVSFIYFKLAALSFVGTFLLLFETESILFDIQRIQTLNEVFVQWSMIHFTTSFMKMLSIKWFIQNVHSFKEMTSKTKHWFCYQWRSLWIKTQKSERNASDTKIQRI